MLPDNAFLISSSMSLHPYYSDNYTYVGGRLAILAQKENFLEKWKFWEEKFFIAKRC
jgi:hypothetical protein